MCTVVLNLPRASGIHGLLSVPSLLGLAALGGVIGGCGAQQRETLESRLASDILEREPRTLAEAEAELARTKTALGLNLDPAVQGQSDRPGFSPNGELAPNTKVAPPPEQPSAGAPAAPPSSNGNAAPPEDSLHGEAEAAQVQQCITPCRALRSMRQAVNAICRMTGPSDARCSSAHAVLLQAVERTRSCECPAP
jgi:hypothetical protein